VSSRRSYGAKVKESDNAGSMCGKVEAVEITDAQKPDRVGVIALVTGTAINAWSSSVR
jgi:hypothetical protein